MLSILIPTYNYSIVNLVNQVHQQAIAAAIPFEIVVVDDYSSNHSLTEENKSIEQLEFVTFLKNKNNLGRTATRNLLANRAIYNLLLFLDADVLPKYSDFISRFNITENQNLSIIYGGVCYEDEKPELSKILRWEYGRSRETKSVSERQKNPYFIISQNLLISKEVFFEANSENANNYGLDILFSNNLKKKNIAVEHIDNPVYHLGLEDSTVFLNKSLEAVKTTYDLERSHQIFTDLRPLQKSYLFLKKWGLAKVFYSIISPFKNSIKSNLVSKKPSLFLLDLDRLLYFIELKTQKK